MPLILVMLALKAFALVCFSFLGLVFNFFLLLVCSPLLFFFCFVFFLLIGCSFYFSYTPSHVAFSWNQSSQQRTFVACGDIMHGCSSNSAFICRVFFNLFFFFLLVSSLLLFFRFFLLACHFSILMYSTSTFLIN